MNRKILALVVLLAFSRSVLAVPAYTFVSSGTVASNTDSAALAPGAPGSCPSGALVLLATGNFNNNSTATQTPPTGWTLLTQISSGRMDLMAHIKDGTANDTPTVDWTGTGASFAWMDCYSGYVYTDLSTIVAHSAAVSNTGADILFPSLAISTANTLVAFYGRKNKSATSDDATTITCPTGTTKNQQHIGAGANRSAAVTCYVQQTTATTYGGADATINGTQESLTSAGIIVSLKTGNCSIAQPPVITNVATTNEITSAQANVVITGTGFCNAQSTGAVTLRQNGNSKTLSVDSWTETAIQVDMSGVGMGVASGLEYGDIDVRVANSLTLFDDQTTNVVPESGVDCWDLPGTQSPATLSFNSYGYPNRVGRPATDVQTGSQIAFISTPNATGITLAADAALTFSSVSSYQFDSSINNLYTGTITTQPNLVPPTFTGSAIPSQLYAVGTAIQPIQLDSYFTLGASALSAYSHPKLVTETLVDQANGAGVASTTLTVDSYVGITAGVWLKVGTAYAKAKDVNWLTNVIHLWSPITWSDNALISTMSEGTCSITGLSINSTTRQYEGIATAAESQSLCFFRLTDTAGLVSDSW